MRDGGRHPGCSLRGCLGQQIRLTCAYVNPWVVLIQSCVVAGGIGALAARHDFVAAGVITGCLTLATACLVAVKAISNLRRSSDAGSQGADETRRRHDAVAFGSFLIPIASGLVAGYFRGAGSKAVDPLVAYMVILTGGAAIVYVSSLIDWAYVRPRLAGLRPEDRPCTSSLAPTWGRVTRVWLCHRLFAALAFIGCPTAAVGLAAFSASSDNAQVESAVIAAVASIVAGYYLRRIAPMVALVLSPAIWVGDKITLAERYQPPQSVARGYYVADFGVEGFKLRELAPGDRLVAEDAPLAGYDRLLDLQDALELVRTRAPFVGCGPQACRLVNPYCPKRREFEKSRDTDRHAASRCVE